MTSLTVNGSAVAASTLAAAGKLFNATGGTSGNTSTKVGTSTLFKQLFAKGTTTNQTGVSSIPTPTDSNFNGWMWDVTTLEGQTLASGAITPTFHLLASTGTTVTPTVAWYKRSSGGVYTQIATVTGSSIALTTSAQALTFTPPTGTQTDFATGDKLVMWLWVNQTAGGATNSTISVVEATSGSTSGVASEAQAATPGYAPTPVALAVTLSGTGTLAGTLSPVSAYATVVLADTPLRYYRLDEASGTTAINNGSQKQNDGTLHGTITLSQTGLPVSDPDTAELFDGATGTISFADTGLPTGASGAFSLECWVNFAAGVSFSGFPFLMWYGSTGVNGGVALYIDSSGAAAIGFGNGGGNVLGSVIAVSTTYHLVGTYDGSALRIYVNGALTGGPTTTTGNVSLSAGAIAASATPGNYANATIDEAALYSGALSAARIMTHYIAGTWTATMPGTGTLTGTLTRVAALSATLTGTGTLSGALSLATALSASLTGVGALSGALSASLSLATTLAGMGTLTGTLATSSGTVALTGECDGSGALTATLSLSTALAGTLVGSGALTATLSLSTALAGTLVGSGALTATLVAQTALLATCAGAGQLSGTLALSTALALHLDGTGTLTGVFSLQVALSLVCAGAGTLSGLLSIPPVPGVKIVWVTRDMKARWVSRDMQTTWTTRDEKTTWTTRGGY